MSRDAAEVVAINRVNWTVVAVIGIIVLLVLAFGTSLLSGWGYGGYAGYGGFGMMGPWLMTGMFFMWLIPVGFLLLLGLGLAWIIRAVGGTGNFNPPSHRCPSCGRTPRAGWRNCPYCGAPLAK